MGRDILMDSKEIDIDGAKKAAIELFKCLNISLPDETPERFSKMMHELTYYQNISNKEIANIVNKTFEFDNKKAESSNMVVIKNIDAFSLCEHHIALIYDMHVSVAYIPQKCILGLSKIVRLVDMVCKRLQLQEKICNDIIEIMSILTKSDDIAVHIEAKHSCVTARGIQNVSSGTITTSYKGIFLKDNDKKNEFLSNLKN